MRRRWLVVGVLAGAAGAAVLTSTLSSPGPILAAGRSVAVRPMVWHGRFVTAGRHEVQRVCEERLAGKPYPDLGDGFERPHHPIQTGQDWLEVGPHAPGHWSTCREAIYNRHYGPVARYRRAHAARASHLDAFALRVLTLAELPAELWDLSPFDQLEDPEKGLLHHHPASRVVERGARLLHVEIGLGPVPGVPNPKPDWLILTETGRADFTGDGVEDVLLHFRRGYGGGTGFNFGHVLVTRSAADAALAWEVSVEGAH